MADIEDMEARSDKIPVSSYIHRYSYYIYYDFYQLCIQGIYFNISIVHQAQVDEVINKTQELEKTLKTDADAAVKSVSLDLFIYI